MFIYIRHFYKEYSNGKSETFPFDPQIVEDHKGIIPELGRQLISLYGKPKTIYVSPFERTRQTANCLLNDNEVQKTIDLNLSEYISKKHKEILNPFSIRESTSFHCPPILEGHNDLKFRVEDHLRSRENLSTDTYWFVTHGIIIKNILKKYGVEYYPQPLEAIIIDTKREGGRMPFIFSV